MGKFIEAILVLSGMIIGVGIFAIPFSFVAAGFWLGTAELLFLAGIMVFLHLWYAEIVLASVSPHRLPGFVRLYLGNYPGIFAAASAILGILGSLLAYILVGSVFLHAIAKIWWGGSSEFFWALAMVLSGALIMLFSLKKEALLNGMLTALLIIFLLFLIAFLFPAVDFKNFSGISLPQAFVPYGVLLFALAGSVAIPDVVSLLNRDRRQIRKAIIIGTFIPALIYFLFAYAVVGVAGGEVSEEAIIGLKNFAGDTLVLLGSVIGFLAVYTSFIILASNFRDLLALDFSIPRGMAWFSASVLPFFFYLLGFQNFIAIIGAVGTIAGGIEAGFIVSMHHKIQQARSIFSNAWKAGIVALVLAGVAYELYLFF